ncbi:hypothetical protein GCM10009560_52640 [Nonomuraea longicatena]|uniref:Secreted protein n=1 Tax=Nonomuraea longicatena TaxID=83682 RepID=A0ABN1QD24_9ACTN
MLGVAMLAPAILAGGLMVGELTGYEAEAQEPGAGMAVGPGTLAFEPIYVPAPLRPDLIYEGIVPRMQTEDPVREAPVEVVPEVRAEVPATVRRVVDLPAEQPEQRDRCPGEWEETWLWELCLANLRDEG